MKCSPVLMALIILGHLVFAQTPSLKTQADIEQSMLKIQREGVSPTLRELMEIREYTHPLLKKYLPDYRFYLAYIPAHKQKVPQPDRREKEIPVEASYLTGLGVVNRENRLSLFENKPRPFMDLGRTFLKTAKIARSKASRTDQELKEIASMYLILSSLKGLNGKGFLWLTKAEAPGYGNNIVREIKPEEFTLHRRANGVTVSYKIDNELETMECSLSFDLKGNVITGKAYQWAKVKAL